MVKNNIIIKNNIKQSEISRFRFCPRLMGSAVSTRPDPHGKSFHPTTLIEETRGMKAASPSCGLFPACTNAFGPLKNCITCSSVTMTAAVDLCPPQPNCSMWPSFTEERERGCRLVQLRHRCESRRCRSGEPRHSNPGRHPPPRWQRRCTTGRPRRDLRWRQSI